MTSGFPMFVQIPKGLSAFWDVAYVHADLVTPLQAPTPSLQPKPAVVAQGGIASPTSTSVGTPHTPAAIAAACAAAVTDGGNGVGADKGSSSNDPTNPLAPSPTQTISLASVNNADGTTGSTPPSLAGSGSAMANDRHQSSTTDGESKVATVAVSVAPATTATVAIGARVHWKATLTAWWTHLRSGNAWKELKAAHGKDMFRPLAAHSEFRTLSTSQPLPTLVELYGSPDGVAHACRAGKTALTFYQVEQFMPSSFEVVDSFVTPYSVSKSYFAIVDLFAALLLVLCAAALAQVKVLALLALLFLTVGCAVGLCCMCGPHCTTRVLFSPLIALGLSDCARLPHPCHTAKSNRQRQCSNDLSQLHQDRCQCVLRCWLARRVVSYSYFPCFVPFKLPWPSPNCPSALSVSKTSWLWCWSLCKAPYRCCWLLRKSANSSPGGARSRCGSSAPA